MPNFIRYLMFVLMLPCLSAFAQLTGSPADFAQPVYPYEDPHRAVVVRVNFNSATDVDLLEVLVANTRAKTSIGAPPLILLELIDHNDEVISSQNDWHPLWEHRWDEAHETESLAVLDSGEGTFYLPLSSSLRKVRITDLELDEELITVDVAQAVMEYCGANPTTTICVLFVDGFE